MNEDGDDDNELYCDHIPARNVDEAVEDAVREFIKARPRSFEDIAVELSDLILHASDFRIEIGKKK